MNSNKKCKWCKNKILIDDKFVLLATYKGIKSLEKVWFHLNCYTDWYESKIYERLEKLRDQSMTMLQSFSFLEPERNM